MSERCTNFMTSSTGEMARRGGEDGSFITISRTVIYISAQPTSRARSSSKWAPCRTVVPETE